MFSDLKKNKKLTTTTELVKTKKMTQADVFLPEYKKRSALAAHRSIFTVCLLVLHSVVILQCDPYGPTPNGLTTQFILL